MFLPAFLRFNAAELHAGFADLLAVLGLKSAEAFADDLTLKMEKLGAPTRLGPLGVALEDINDIARRGVGRSTEWNPRKVHQDDIIAICQQML
jgi:alcohol dehydrogenase